MIRKATLEVVLTLVLLGMLVSISHIQPVEAEPTTWTVDDDGPADFHTIQEAINSANSGDTVYVYNGEYNENLGVNKAVSLLGENMETTIIVGNMSGEPVKVTARNAKISGFTIQASTSHYASVRLFSSGNSILNNNLTGGWCGVWMEHYSEYNLIADNTITGNLNGIAGEMWHYTEIISNTIENNLMGIWIGPYSRNNVVSFNNINGHLSEGIMMMQSSNNLFEGNNIVDNNQGGFSAGITIGFQEGFSSGNKFFHNNIASTGQQIKLYGSGTIIWDDGYPSGGNYWGDYTARYPSAQELDGSGIWDTPYKIDENNQDNYPLMEPWAPPSPIPTTIGELKTKIVELGSEGKIDNQGIVNSLVSKLDVAQGLVDKGKIDAAKTVLANGFISQVQGLSGIRITVEAADILVESAQYIISHL